MLDALLTWAGLRLGVTAAGLALLWWRYPRWRPVIWYVGIALLLLMVILLFLSGVKPEDQDPFPKNSRNPPPEPIGRQLARGLSGLLMSDGLRQSIAQGRATGESAKREALALHATLNGLDFEMTAYTARLAPETLATYLTDDEALNSEQLQRLRLAAAGDWGPILTSLR